MKCPLIAASLVFLGACGKTPRVYVALHALSDRPAFEIEDGHVRHLDIVSCDDTTRPVWQADASAGDTLPSLVTDSTVPLDGECYYVRWGTAGRRHFSVRPNRYLMQDVP